MDTILERVFFGRKSSATLLICIQRKHAPFSTMGRPANTTRREEALLSEPASLSINVMEIAASGARGIEDGESFKTLG